MSIRRPTFSLFLLLSCGIFCLLSTSCSSPGGESLLREDVGEPETSDNSEALKKALQERQAYYGPEPFYEPGMSISIEVTVQGNVEQKIGERRIDPRGEITLPLIQDIKIGNQTGSQIEEQLAEAYAKYYVNPSVLINYVGDVNNPDGSPWGYVTVLGYVSKPGRVAVTPSTQLTVSSALQKVGGYQRGTKLTSIKIYRPKAGGETETINVDIKRFGTGRGDDFDLKRGDVIWVQESVW